MPLSHGEIVKVEPNPDRWQGPPRICPTCGVELPMMVLEQHIRTEHPDSLEDYEWYTRDEEAHRRELEEAGRDYDLGDALDVHERMDDYIEGD